MFIKFFTQYIDIVIIIVFVRIKYVHFGLISL